MDRYDPFSGGAGGFGGFDIAEFDIHALLNYSLHPIQHGDEVHKLGAIKSARNLNIDMKILGYENSDRSMPWTTLKVFCEELVKNCQDMLSVKIIFDQRKITWGVESRIASARAFSSLRNLPSSCVLDLQGLDDETYELYWKGIAEV